MSKLRESARGQECTVRLEHVCNFNPDTTVLAHLNGAGMGMKDGDVFGAFACSTCHAVLDGMLKSDYTPDYLYAMHLAGVIRTQRWWHENGYLTWDGDSTKLKDAQAIERKAVWVKRLASKLV